MTIPWKYICIFLLFQIYGPEFTSVKFTLFSNFFSQDYCKDNTNKVQCVVDQLNGLVILANKTYHKFWLGGLIEGMKEFFTNEKEKDLLYTNSTGAVKGNISIAMSELLEKMQKEYEKTLRGDSAKLVKQRLGTITFDHQTTSAFCTMDFGLDPFVTAKRIGNIAEMTKMPRHLQNILEQTVKVIDAGSSMAQNTPIAVEGIVHFILIAAYRNANNSFDIGMAVFSIDYKVSPKEYQYGDEEMFRKFLRFSRTNTVDDDGRLTFQGMEDLKAYFYGEAYKAMHRCPLKGFRKVEQEIKSET